MRGGARRVGKASPLEGFADGHDTLVEIIRPDHSTMGA
jgi:hypothetical protein